MAGDKGTEAALQAILDRQAVIDVVIRFARALDLQDWDLFLSCYDRQVTVDYAQFTGTPTRVGPPEMFLDYVKRALKDQKSQHLSTNHVVEIDGDTATCWSNMTGLHYREMPDGRNRLDLYGYYEMELVRRAGGWKISRQRQNILWREGNPDVIPGGIPSVDSGR